MDIPQASSFTGGEMRLAIMQPYFFPYIGYWQLINVVDRFVLYDDVSYINRGWINRNFILGPQKPQRITLQLNGASQNKLINEISVGDNKKKLIKTIEQRYSKAKYFRDVFPLIEECSYYNTINLAIFLDYSIRRICSYLDIQTEIIVSSEIYRDVTMKGSDAIIDICNKLGAETYINAIGGKELYNSSVFSSKGIDLFFLKTQNIIYRQYSPQFVPNLSIIDVMMFCDINEVRNLLEGFNLVR